MIFKTDIMYRHFNVLFLRFIFFLALFFVVNQANAEDAHHSDDIKLGERLFNGLISTGENTKACVSCHAYYVADTLNWNPSAADVALRASMMDSASFAANLLRPSGNMMGKVHVNYNLEATQIVQLQAYLKHLHEVGVAKSLPSYNKIIIVLILSLLIVFAIVDLFFTQKIPYIPIHIIVIVICFAFILKLVAHQAIDFGRSKNYEPDQPIKFSHKVHSKDNKIDCFYCHTNADEGKQAGIPSANVCMNCHVIVREGSNSGKFEISKLVDHVEKGKDIEWIRIHQLPDHVYFNHEQHVKVGKLDCKECHGAVEEMDRVKQVNDLSMGWCLDCHRTKNVQFTDNDYYKKSFEKYHEAIKNGEMDSVKVVDIGGADCMKCHY